MSRSKLLIVTALVLLISLPAGAALAQDAEPMDIGTAIVFDSLALGDALVYAIEGAEFPPEGSEYVGWLVSDNGSRKLSTGPMTLAAGGDVSMVFDSTNPRYTGENLIEAFNKVVITVEDAGADPDAPAGPPAYAHAIPLRAMAHIRHLLTDWPVGTGVGILTNLKDQLDVAILYANLARTEAVAGNLDRARLHIHHVINIIEGPGGPNYDISFGDPGDGEGVLLHAADRKHAGFAAGEAPDGEVMAAHAALVEEYGKNAADWATDARDISVDTLTRNLALTRLFIGPGGSTIISQLDAARNGFLGDGGAEQAYVEAQLMATYTLVPGGPAVSADVPPPGVGDASVPVLAQLAVVAALLLLAAGGLLAYSGLRSRAKA